MTGRKRANRWNLGAGAVVCLVAAAIPLVWPSQLPPDVPFLDGIAWLTSGGRDEVVRVNGQTGQVDASLPLDGADDATVTQAEGIVLVELDGEIRQIDLASLEWGGSIAADGDLAVGDDAEGNPVVYLVMPDGEVRELDPGSLQTRHRLRVDGRPGAAVVAGRRLVAPVHGSEATSVQIIEGDRLVGTTEVGGPDDHVVLSRVGREVAVVNLSTGRLSLVDPGGADASARDVARLDLPAGDIVVPATLPEGLLWLVALREGELLGVDLATGEVTTRVEVADNRADLGGPVVLNGTVHLVDRDTGTAIQVAADAGADPARTTPEVVEQPLADLGMEDASRAEISVVAGQVFINDPAGDTAVVFSDDGTAQGVDKYDGSAPHPDRSGDPGDPDETDGDTGPPSPTTTTTSPAPAAPGTTSPTAPPTSAPPNPPPPTATTPPPTATTPPPPTTPARPPGPVELTAAPGDGRVTLSWTAASSGTPVTYHVSSDRPVDGRTAWTTGGLSLSLGALTNGDPYRLTVTPSNQAGNGPSSSATVVTAGAPALRDVVATPDGGRSIVVTFGYDLNGSELEACQVSTAGITRTGSCSGGRGSAQISVPDFNTEYSFTVSLRTSVGQARGQATARSATKPLTVDGSASRWAGSCYYPDHGTSRPVVAQPVDACLEQGSSYHVRLAADGSTERVECWRRDATIQDDLGNTSDVWLRLADGWMNALYFDDWDAADGNLPAC